MTKIKIPLIPVDIEGPKYKLTKVGDNFGAKFADRIAWIEWTDKGHYKEKHDEPSVGLSLILDPHNFSYSWLTTVVTEIIEETEDSVEFKTLNSHYKLEKIKDENRD